MLLPIFLALAFYQQTAPKPEVLFWPHGVSPLGPEHKDVFDNHLLEVSHREKSGNVEVHLTKTDVMVIQSGTATLVYGGEGVGMHPTAPNELQGTSIKGGQQRRVEPGDVIHIPTAVPHQFLLAPGETITYLVVKVVDPPPTTAQNLEPPREKSTAALHIDVDLPSLSITTFGSENINQNIHIERVTFNTQFGQWIPAIVYVPNHPKARTPAIVVVNGHGGDKSSWYAAYTGMLYATAGAVVITYDPIGEFERSTTRGSEVGEHDKPQPGLDHPELVGGLMIEDVLQSLRYAASRPDVDRTRIALLGYSMGSFHALLASALTQTPVRALVLSGGGNLDGPNEYWDNPNKPNCQSGPYKALSFLGDRAAILWALRTQSGPTLVLNGTEDGLITKFNEQEPFFNTLRDHIAAVTGTRTNLPETVWYPGVGHRASFMTREAALWLNHQLQFPNWTDAQIQAFPTIRAADWVAKTHVRISKGYDAEQKEGGTLALDLNLPALTRDQLTVVPESKWQHDRTRYTLESWTSHAIATQSK